MTTYVSRTNLRRTLCMTTALAGGMLLIAAPGRAQILPAGPSFPDGQTNPTITNPTPNSTRIETNQNRSIINWQSFSIGTGDSVDFQNGLTNPANRVAILNRVIGSGGTIPQSNIQGSLTSSSNISVYLINPTGIVFGNGANVNVGGLIASTLDISDSNFMAGTNSFLGSGLGGVEMLAGSTINSGEIVAFIGDFVNVAGGTIGGNAAGSADNPDNVVFVAGSDVSMSAEPGSPLSLTINQGSAVNTGVVVGGTVNGQNVYVGMATRTGVTDAVLNISGMVTATTATASDRGIVLAAGTSADGITVAGGGADTTGNARVSISGTLAAGDGGAAANTANVEVRARNGIATAGSGATVTAADQVTLDGAVTLGADLTATSSGGDVRFAGAISGGNDLIVRAAGAATFAGAVSVDALGVEAGSVSFGATTNSVGTLAADIATGGIAFSNTPGLTIGTVGGIAGVSAAAGDVAIVSGGGVTLTEGVTASTGNVDLAANGGTLTGAGVVSGIQVALRGSAGIGADGARVNTAADALAADGGSGGVFVSEADAVTLQDVGARANGSAGSYDLVAGGAVTVERDVTSTGSGVSLATSVGDINIAATGTVNAASGTLLLNAAGAIDATAGAVLTANDIMLRAANFTGAIFANAVLQEGNNLSVTDTAGGLTLASLSAANRLDIDVLGGGGLIVTDTLAAGGTVDLSAAAITFDGVTVSGSNVIVGGPLTLTTAGSTVSGSGSGTVLFNGTINGGQTLGVTASGGTTFAGAVGTTTALTSLTVTGPAAIDGGAVTTTGAQSYSGLVTLGADTVLTGGSGTFGAGVTGNDNDLTLNFGGTTVLNGSFTGIGDLATGGGGTTELSGSITTSGSQNFGEPVTLAGNTQLTSSGNGAIAFGGTVNGGSTLTVTTSGLTSFAGIVGGGTALTALTTNGGGTTALNGGAVTTTGAQSYDDAVALGANTVLTGGSGIFGAGVDGNGFDLTLNFGGTTAIDGSFTEIDDLATGGGGTTQLSGSITTTGTQNFGEPVTLAGDTQLTSSGNGAIAFGGTVNGASALAVTTAGLTSFAGVVGGTTALTSLTTNGGGATSLGGDVTTSAAQLYSDAVSLGADVILTGTDGTISGAITGNGNDLNLIFSGATVVGAGATGLATLASSGGGTTELNGTISSSGSQTYVDAVTLGSAVTAVSTGDDLIDFQSTINGGQALTVTTGGETRFGAAVGGATALASLTTDAPGTTAINGGGITTTGAQTFNDAVTLGADTILTSTSGGAIGFGQTVDGARRLTVATTGTTSFSGAVGGTTALTRLIVNGPVRLAGAANLLRTVDELSLGPVLFADSLVGLVRLEATATDGTISVGAISDANTDSNDLTLTAAGGIRATDIGSLTNPIGDLTFNGDTRLASVIVSDGAVVFNDDLVLADGTHSITGASTEFNGTINGESEGQADLSVTATDTTNTFDGAIGDTAALAALTVNGDTLLNGGAVTTTGAQTFNDLVTLGAALTTLTSSGGGGTFAALDGGGNDLTMSFAGPIDINGDFTNLGNLRATGDGIDFETRTLSASDDVVLDGMDGDVNGGTVTAGNDIAITGDGVDADSLTAGDDIAIRAGGAVTVATLTSGPKTETDGGNGAADMLASADLSGNDIDVVGGSIAVTSATANENGAGSDLRLTATTGDLAITTGTAGAFATLTAAGAATGGTITAQGGDVTVTAGPLVDFDTLSASRDILVRAGNSMTPINGSIDVGNAEGVDIVFEAIGGSITAGAITARDDIVLGAGTSISTGALTSTGAAEDNGSGAGDAAVAGGAVDLTGGGSILAAAGDGSIVTGAIDSDVDVALLAMTSVNTQAITAGDDIAIRAGTNISTGDLTSGTDAAAEDVDGAADFLAGARLDDGNIFAVANGSVSTGALISGADIALGAGGDVTTGDQSARDDIVVRAGGLVTAGDLTSGTPANSDDPIGAGERLLAERMESVDLSGYDIDIRGNGLRLGLVRANGTGSDVRLTGGEGGIGRPGDDVDIRSGGDIMLGGLVHARDVALEAGGLVNTQEIRARDDIAIRAVGRVDTGALTSGVDTAVDTDTPPPAAGEAAQAGAADNLLGMRIVGHDIDVRGSDVNVPQATTVAFPGDLLGASSDLRLEATSGRLQLGVGLIGGQALLDKKGAVDELQVAALAAGTAFRATGDVTIRSATNVRAGSVEARGGAIDIRAGVDTNGDGVRDGDVTGLAGASNGLRTSFGRAVLSAIPATGAPAGDNSNRSVAVVAGGLVQLGAVTAGENVTVTAGSAGVADRDGAIDISSVNASRGALALSAFNNDPGKVAGIRLGSSNADPAAATTDAGALDSNVGTTVSIVTTSDLPAQLRNDIVVARNLIAGNAAGSEGTVTIDSVADAHLASGAFRIESRTGSIAVNSRNGDITGIVPATDAERGGSASLEFGQVTSDGAIAINSDRDIRIGSATSRGGDINVFTFGSLTGLAVAGSTAPAGANLVASRAPRGADGRDVAVFAQRLARLGTVSATRDISVFAGAASIQSADAGRNFSAQSTFAAGAAIEPTRLWSANDILAPAYGQAQLTAEAVNRRITVNLGQIAQLGQVRAGAGTSQSGDQINVSARALSVAQAVAANGGLLLNAREGGLYLGTNLGVNEGAGQLGTEPGASSAGTRIVLTKAFATETQDANRADLNNELRIRTELIANTADGANDDVTITSARDVRLRQITANRNGSIDIAAGANSDGGSRSSVRRGDVTGLAGPGDGNSDSAFGRGDLTAAGQNVRVRAGGLVQLDDVIAGRNVALIGGGSGAFDINGAVDVVRAEARSGELVVQARGGSPIDAVRDGDIVLETGLAGTTATLDNLALRGTSGEVRVGSITSGMSADPMIVAPSRDTTISSVGNVRLDQATAQGGSVTIRAGAEGFGAPVRAGQVSGRAGSSNGLAPTFGRSNLTASASGVAGNQSVSVTAGELVQFGAVTADDNISVSSGTRDFAPLDGAIDISSANAANGSLTLTAFNDSSDPARLADIRLGVTNAGGGPATDSAAGDSSAGTTVTLTTTGAMSPDARGDIVIGRSLTARGAPDPMNPSSRAIRFDSVRDILLAAAPFEVRATQGDVALSARRNITGLPAGGAGTGEALVPGSGLRAGTLTAGRDVNISGAGNVRLRDVTSTSEDVDIRAGGSATGLSLTDRGDPISFAGRVFAGRDLSMSGGALVRVSEAAAGTANAGQTASPSGGNLTVSAFSTATGTIAIGTATARAGTARPGSLTLTASGMGLHLGTGRADGMASLTTQTAGTITRPTPGNLGDPDAASRDRLDIGHGFANLFAPTANRTIVVVAGSATSSTAPPFGAAQLGTVSAGAGDVVGGLSASQIFVNVDRLTVQNVTARNGALALFANEGPLYLGTGSAGTTASLNKRGAADFAGNELRVRNALTAGTATGAAGGAFITTETNARLATVIARNGPVTIRAGAASAVNPLRDGDVTGLAVSSPIGAQPLNRSYDRAVLTAGTSVLVLAGGLIQLGAVNAGTAIRAEAGTNGIAERDGAIDISSAIAASGSLTLTAFNDSTDPARLSGVRLGTLDTAAGPATDVNAANSSAGTTALLETRGTRGDVVVGRSLTAGGTADLVAPTVRLTSARDVLLAAAPFELRATRGDIAISAVRNLTGLPAGGTGTGEALVGGSGLRVATLTSGGDVVIEGAGNVRLGDVTSTSEDIAITAGGSVTGLSLVDGGDAINGAGRIFAGRDVTVTAGPLARISEVAAGTTDTGQTATATGGNLAVTAGTIAIQNAAARGGADRAGDMTLTARDVGLHLGTGSADGDITLTTQSAGALATPATGDLGSPDASSRDILDTAHGFANLDAQAAARTVSVTAGTQTPGDGSFGVAQLGTVNAGAGNDQSAGTQVAVTADRLTVTNLDAANGALVLEAREGPLYLGTGTVGTTARLDKQGAADFAGNELRVRGTLTTGTATGATGDATLISATDARLGTIAVQGGSIDIRAGADSAGDPVRDGDVTGLAVATPITAVGLAASHDRAVLTATNAIAVRAGGLVQAGAVRAGTDILVEAGSASIADRDGAIDISSAVAATGSLSLSAYNDDAAKVADIRLGTVAGDDGAATDENGADSDAGTTASLVTTGGRGDVVVGRSLRAGGTVAIDSTSDVRFAPDPFEVRSRGGDIIVAAVRDVTGLVAGGTGTGAALVGGGELRAESLTSGGDLAIDARGDVRLGAATSIGGSVTIGADGSVTGLADPAAVTGAGRLFASRDVTVTAGPVARISEIAAGTVDTGATGGNVAVTADLVAVEDARARSGSERDGDIALTSRGSGLHLGAGRADGQLALSTGAAGARATPTAGNLGGADDPTRDVLDTAHGAADIAAATSVTVIAGRDTPGAAPFGVAQLDVVTAGTDATVTADRLTVADLAAGDALALTTREGPLFLGAGSAGTSATLVKGGGGLAFAGDELRVRDSLIAGTDATIRSATDARLGTVTATAGTIAIRAGAGTEGAPVRTGEVTGLAVSSPIVAAGLSATHGRATLTGGGSVDVEAGGLVQLADVRAGQDIRVEAGSEGIADRDGAVDITSAAAANGSLVLRAFNNDAGRAAGVRLGTTDDGGTARSDAAAADSLAGTRIELRTLGTRGDIVVGQSLTANGALGSGDITLGSVADVRLASAADAAADADPEGVRSLNDDVLITAAGSVTGLVAGGTDLGRAGSGELRAGTVTGAGDIVIEGAGNVRLRDVTSRAEDIAVTAGGSVTGLANGDNVDAIGGAGRLFAGRDVRVTAGDTARVTRIVSGRNSDVGATTIAVGRTNAGANVAMTAGGTGLHVGTSEAGGATTLRTGTAGTLATPTAGALGNSQAADRDTLDTGNGFANLTAQAANKTIAVTAGTLTPGAGPLGVAQLGTVSAGAGTGTATPLDQVAVVADRLTVTSATANNGALVLTAREGPLLVGAGRSGTAATLAKQGGEGDLRVRELSAGATATLTSSTNARLGNIESRGADLLVTAANAVTGQQAGANFVGADLKGDGRVQVRAGADASGLVRISDVTATRGDIDIQAGNAAGAASVVEILDIASAGANYRVTAGAITLGGDADAETQSAGGTVELTALTGAVTGGAGLTLQSNRDGSGAEPLIVRANGGSGSITFAADNRVLGGTGSGSDVTIDTVGTATLAQVTATGRTITINANDLELQGASASDQAARIAAANVNITNRADRAGTTRLGNGLTGSGGFALSQAELNRISADRVRIESGSQNVAIGNLALTPDVGRANLALLTTARVDVTGTVATANSPTTRTIQIGGTSGTADAQDASTLASVIAVAPGSTGGGRLLAGSANLDLRAGFIGVGLSGFLNEIGLDAGGSPASNDTINNQFIANPSSTLYVAGLGVPYQDKVFLTANLLSVTYTNYALFQNTVESVSGIAPTGVEIGGLNVAPALSLGSTGDSASNGFALFGRINEQGGNQAALLGPQVIPLTGVNRSNTRINGCLVGSGGGGCLVSAVGTPPLNEFDEGQANILQTAEDLEDRFDPIVGTNNEALFTGISSIDELVEPEVDCEGDPENSQCAAARPDPAAQQDTNTP